MTPAMMPAAAQAEQGWKFLDVSGLSTETLLELKASDPDVRLKTIRGLSKRAETVGPEQVRRRTRLSLLDEAVAVLLFALGVPGFVFAFPAALLVVYFLMGTR